MPVSIGCKCPSLLVSCLLVSCLLVSLSFGLFCPVFGIGAMRGMRCHVTAMSPTCRHIVSSIRFTHELTPYVWKKWRLIDTSWALETSSWTGSIRFRDTKKTPQWPVWHPQITPKTLNSHANRLKPEQSRLNSEELKKKGEICMYRGGFAAACAHAWHTRWHNHMHDIPVDTIWHTSHTRFVKPMSRHLGHVTSKSLSFSFLHIYESYHYFQALDLLRHVTSTSLHFWKLPYELRGNEPKLRGRLGPDRLSVRPDAFIHTTWLIYMSGMTHLYLEWLTIFVNDSHCGTFCGSLHSVKLHVCACVREGGYLCAWVCVSVWLCKGRERIKELYVYVSVLVCAHVCASCHKSCHIYKSAIPHVWISHVTHVKKSRHSGLLCLIISNTPQSQAGAAWFMC